MSGSCTRILTYPCSIFSTRRELFCLRSARQKTHGFSAGSQVSFTSPKSQCEPPRAERDPKFIQVHSLTIPAGPSYLAFAGCARRSHHRPYSATKPCDSVAIWTGFPDVIGDVVSQTGVTDTVRTALSFWDGCVLAVQSRALKRPTIHLSFLQKLKPMSLNLPFMNHQVTLYPFEWKSTALPKLQ